MRGLGRKGFHLRHGSGGGAGLVSSGEAEETLVELCRAGVLELGISQGESTYRVSERFARTLEGCHVSIMVAGGYSEDPVAEVSLLAVVHWFGGLRNADAVRLGRVLVAVIDPEDVRGGENVV